MVPNPRRPFCREFFWSGRRASKPATVRGKTLLSCWKRLSSANRSVHVLNELAKKMFQSVFRENSACNGFPSTHMFFMCVLNTEQSVRNSLCVNYFCLREAVSFVEVLHPESDCWRRLPFSRSVFVLIQLSPQPSLDTSTSCVQSNHILKDERSCYKML